MRRTLAILFACLILPLAGLALILPATPGVSARLAADGTCEVRVRVNGVEQWQAMPPEFCIFPTPEPTATTVPPTATTEPTHTPHPTATPVTLTGWHAPAGHDGLNVHEHGDAPPAWVLASAHQPFAQTRESHVGYKGVIGTMGNGTQSYLITHILTATAARSHGDHDYQLWVRDPTGAVSYWDGVLDFGTPPVLRTSDTGERPIILRQNGCEVWYSRPGALVFDMGWVICNRYQEFDGTILGGNGSYRSADWTIQANRFGQFPGAAPTLAQYCTQQYGLCYFQFVVTGHQYPANGVTPIN